MRVRTIEEKSYELLEEFLAGIHGTVDAWLHAIRFPNRNPPRQSFSAVAEFDVEHIPAKDHGYAVKGIAVPGCLLA